MFPTHMQKLINLHHLDIIGTSLKRMPIQISRLKCLWTLTLTKFFVNKNIGFQIGELGKLPNLRGAILIAKLQDVINPTNAFYAKLKAKRQLKDLTLEWDADFLKVKGTYSTISNLIQT